LHFTIFERPANFEFFNRQLADRFKTAICRVGEKKPDRSCMRNALRVPAFSLP
jgi:hypothetical protein